MSHPTTHQIEMLLNKLEENPDIARGFLRTQNARQRARKFWEQMQLQLNSFGTVKTWKQWMKYWTDKKSATKKKAAQRDATRRKTDGAAEVEVELTTIDERILAMMGSEGSSMGDSHLRVPLIHESSEAPQKLDAAEPKKEIVLSEVKLSINENTTGTTNTPEPILGTSPTGHHLSRAASLDISEPEILRRHSPQSQTPTHSPRRRRYTSPTTSPRRRRVRTPISPPHSQRQSRFARTTERFLRLEERRIDIEEKNASFLRAVFERSAQREDKLFEALTNVSNRVIEQNSQQNTLMAAALKTVGEGLIALSEAIKPKT